MLPALSCLLVLVSVAATSGRRDYPPDCYSPGLDQSFYNGDEWTEPGCARAECVNGRTVSLPCGLVGLEPDCVLEEGTAGAPYPACCPHVTCPNPDQCYVKRLDRIFNDGEEWTNPGCVGAQCNRGRVSQLPCGLINLQPDSSCILDEGIADEPYPACCPRATCPNPDQCYVKRLNRIFNDGEEWTNPGCVRAQCNQGRVSELPCGLINLQPDSGCILEEGIADAPYPACCPGITCPNPDQCYVKKLNKVFEDGDHWSEKPCLRAICEKGSVLFVPCAVMVPRPGCRIRDGNSDTPYPICCPTEVCY